MLVSFLSGLLAASFLLLGSIVPFVRKGHSEAVLHRIMAFGSGVLLGTAFLHLIPEASRSDPLKVGYGLAIAFLAIFGIEHATIIHACHKYYHEFLAHPEQFHSKLTSFVSMIAFLLHSLLDGLALAASFAISIPLGMATSAAVLVHQFPIGISLSSIFLHHKEKLSTALFRSLLVAISIPLGALLAYLWLEKINPSILSLILGFSAGSFIYIGATDILPEVHHKHDIWCFISFVIGIGIMYAAKVLG